MEGPRDRGRRVDLCLLADALRCAMWGTRGARGKGHSNEELEELEEETR